MKHTVATKRKLSAMRKGDKNPFYGRKHTEAFKAALRIRMKDNTYRRFVISPCTLKPFNEIVGSYVAAMIDGEGSIAMHRVAPGVAIYNTSVPLMRWLCRNVGGSYIKGGRGTSAMRNPKQCYVWNVASARNVFTLLTKVRHMLVIKGDKADMVLNRLRAKYGDRLTEEGN